MSKRDVLVVFAGTEGYGVRRGTLALASGLSATGFSIKFAAVSEGPVLQELVALGHDVARLTTDQIRAPSGGIAKRVSHSLSRVGHLARIAHGLDAAIRKTRPSMIYFRVPNLVLPVGLVTKRHNVRAYWHMPNLIGSDYPWQLNRRLYWAVLDHCPVTPLANSKYTADSLNRGNDRVSVLHVGTDEAVFDPACVESPVRRDELDIPAHAVVFGIAARLVARKGQLRFLEALSLLPPDVRSSVHLVLLGGPTDSPYAASLRDTARKAGMERQVHLLGATSNPERYYALMDVAVSSRLDAEPYGQSVVEAMMMTRPVLAHALGGPAETVLDGTTGWHVVSPDARDFAAGVSRALGQRANWPAMGQAARYRALEKYSLRVQVEQFLALSGAAEGAAVSPQ